MEISGDGRRAPASGCTGVSWQRTPAARDALPLPGRELELLRVLPLRRVAAASAMFCAGYQRWSRYGDDNDCMTMHREPGGERYYVPGGLKAGRCGGG